MPLPLLTPSEYGRYQQPGGVVVGCVATAQITARLDTHLGSIIGRARMWVHCSFNLSRCPATMLIAFWLLFMTVSNSIWGCNFRNVPNWSELCFGKAMTQIQHLAEDGADGRDRQNVHSTTGLSRLNRAALVLVLIFIVGRCSTSKTADDPRDIRRVL